MKQKFLTILASAVIMFSVFAAPTVVLASNDVVPLGQIEQPTSGDGKTIGIPVGITLNRIISNALTIVFVIAAIIVLFMLVIGAFNWITSGGDKEAVGKARGRIVNALIGLAVLALAYFIARFVGQLVGIDIFGNTSIPTLGRGGSSTTTITCAPGYVAKPDANNVQHCVKP